MVSTLFIIIYICCIFLSILLIVKSGINLFRISIPMIVFWSIMIFAYIGYPLIYFHTIPYYVNIGITDNEIIWKMFLLSSFVWLQFFAGIFVGGKLLKNKQNQLSINYNPIKNYISILIYSLIFGICIFALLIYLSKVPAIALIELFKGATPVELAYFRSEMTNNFPKYHRYALFFKTIIPFLSYVAWAQVLINRRKIWKLIFCLSFIISCFVLLMDIQKGPFVWYLIAIFMIVFICKNVKIPITTIIKFGFIFLILLVIMYSFFMGSHLNISTLTNPLRRAFTGQLVPLYWYIMIYPNIVGFIGGSTIPNPGGIFPWEPYRYTVEVMNYVKGNQLDNIVGSAPTAFFGELWVNFGVWLCILLPFYLGFIVAFIHRLFTLKPLNSLGIALMVWLGLHLQLLSITGISQYLFDIDLFAIVLITLVLYLTPKIRIHRSKS